LQALGGISMLTKYQGSIMSLLCAVFPEYEWLPWRFDTLPGSYWEDTKNQRKFVEWAAKQLNIKEMSDWYHISYKVTVTIKSNTKISGI
jgi:hypothetical protein